MLKSLRNKANNAGNSKSVTSHDTPEEIDEEYDIPIYDFIKENETLNWKLTLKLTTENNVYGIKFIEQLETYLGENSYQNYQKKSMDDSISIGCSDAEIFGLLLQFTMINRPSTIQFPIIFKIKTNSSTKPVNIEFGTQHIEKDIDEETIQGFPIENPANISSIRVFHIHAHFTKKSEKTALALHKHLVDFITENEETIYHKKVFYQKNGPHEFCRHEINLDFILFDTESRKFIQYYSLTIFFLKPKDKWNWEIHVKSPRAVGLGVTFLAFNIQNDMYFPFHCRTYDINEKNEYYDHIYRLGWVGNPDNEVPLDVNFFKHW